MIATQTEYDCPGLSYCYHLLNLSSCAGRRIDSKNAGNRRPLDVKVNQYYGNKV